MLSNLETGMFMMEQLYSLDRVVFAGFRNAFSRYRLRVFALDCAMPLLCSRCIPGLSLAVEELIDFFERPSFADDVTLGFCLDLSLLIIPSVYELSTNFLICFVDSNLGLGVQVLVFSLV